MYHRQPTLSRPTGGAGALPRLARCAHCRGAASAGHRAALQPPGPGVGPRGGRPSRRGGHPDRVRQDALLQPAGAAVPARAAGGARALSVPHQSARPGSAGRAGGHRQVAARDADVHLRRRHASGRAAGRPGARQPGADQPRHAALGRASPSHEVGDAVPESPLRRHRRAARLPRGLRLPPRERGGSPSRK
jgi:hypothetical protein